MADTSKTLYGPGQPGTTNGTLYTVPASTVTTITSIHVCNTTGAAATLNLALNGTAATAANCIMFEFAVPANAILDMNTGIVLDAAAETIQGLQGTASALTVTISGVENT